MSMELELELRPSVSAASVTGSTSGDLVLELTPAGIHVQILGPRHPLLVPAEELIGRSVRDVLPLEVAEAVMHAIAEVARDGRPRSCELAVPVADPTRHFEARVSSAGNGNLLVVIRDAADPVSGARAREDRDAGFRRMADSAPIMLWTAGTGAGRRTFNRAWTEFSGAPERELGGGWTERIHPDDLERCMDDYRSATAARRRFRVKCRVRGADGEYRSILDTGVPCFEPDGAFVGFAGACIDLSDVRGARQALGSSRQDTDQRFQERSEELARRLKESEVLVREVHHRVKNNLQLVSSMLNMKGRQFRERHLRRALEECQGRVQTIALIHQRLYQSDDLAHIPFAQYARSLVASVFQATGVSPDAVLLQMDVSDVSLSVERAVPCGLILNELITNALRHAFPSGRGGMVRVEIREAGPGRVLLVVADNGVGLPPSLELDEVSSLGLQLVSMLADQLNGALRIERQPGTAFHLEFDADRRATARTLEG